VTRNTPVSISVCVGVHDFYCLDVTLPEIRLCIRHPARAAKGSAATQLQASTRRSASVLRDLTNLSGIFRRAKRLGWVATNPHDNAERVRVKYSGDFNVLSVEQLEATARAASEQNAALYRVAGYAGLRQGELRALRFRDVEFVGSTIHIRRNLPANGDEKVPKSKVVVRCR
jgi:integrase